MLTGADGCRFLCLCVCVSVFLHVLPVIWLMNLYTTPTLWAIFNAICTARRTLCWRVCFFRTSDANNKHHSPAAKILLACEAHTTLTDGFPLPPYMIEFAVCITPSVEISGAWYQANVTEKGSGWPCGPCRCDIDCASALVGDFPMLFPKWDSTFGDTRYRYARGTWYTVALDVVRYVTLALQRATLRFVVAALGNIGEPATVLTCVEHRLIACSKKHCTPVLKRWTDPHLSRTAHCW